MRRDIQQHSADHDFHPLAIAHKLRISLPEMHCTCGIHLNQSTEGPAPPLEVALRCHLHGRPAEEQRWEPSPVKFAQHLGVVCSTDDMPMVARHYEAAVPDKNAPLSQPIGFHWQ